MQILEIVSCVGPRLDCLGLLIFAEDIKDDLTATAMAEPLTTATFPTLSKNLFVMRICMEIIPLGKCRLEN